MYHLYVAVCVYECDVCMYACMCGANGLVLFVYMYNYVYVCMYVWSIYMCMYVCMNMPIWRECTILCSSVHVCIIYLYIYIYVYIYIYIHAYIIAGVGLPR
jgi:hypothetical protein